MVDIAMTAQLGCAAGTVGDKELVFRLNDPLAAPLGAESGVGETDPASLAAAEGVLSVMHHLGEAKTEALHDTADIGMDCP